MASTTVPTSTSQQGLQPTPSSQPRPLCREGAMFLCSAEEQALQDAMLRSSPLPEPVLRKRTRREDDNGDGDTEPDEEASSATPLQVLLPSISNENAATLRYAARKKIRPEQRDELDGFLLDTAVGRQTKLYVLLLSVENKIDAFRSAAPPYQVSEELKTNINNYALAVLLSVKISAYKGDTPCNHILNILKRYRFDLPAGIERDCSSWEKIMACASYSLTQTCAKVKKLIKLSITSNTNIFTLAQQIVHSTTCRPTVQLCARVALMRAVHAECSGNDKYWDLIDKRLELIRKIAGGSASKVAKGFNNILKIDRSTYGVDEQHELEDIVADDWQQRVDDVIAGADSAD